MPAHRLQVISAFPYYTKANVHNEEQKRLQDLLYKLKSGSLVSNTEGQEEDACAWFARAVASGLRKLPEFFGPHVYLVPIPSSSITVLPPRASLWPMYSVTQLLVEQGFGAAAIPALVRKTAVPQAHRTAKEERPTVEAHVASFELDLTALPSTAHVTLVDDVITRGTSATACLVKLRRGGFQGPVRAFTATHTVDASFDGQSTAGASSTVIWKEGEWPYAWRTDVAWL